MKFNRIILLAVVILLVITGVHVFANSKQVDDDRFVTYTVDSNKQNVKLYLKDDKNENFGSIQRLVSWLLKNKNQLLFAMNGGMYNQDHLPTGLYIENQKVVSQLDTTEGNGNFYLKPNGVFYITTDNVAGICKTGDFRNNGKIKYATQSGPMLLIDGQIHTAFKNGSENLNIRNGVGILPDNKVIFVMSKKAINFYDFASYFKSAGCKNALYLDGLVSRAYLPAKQWVQTDGNFGVIIGVTEMAH